MDLSKIAEKSENPEVKNFAGMVQDHTTANQQLMTIATGLGIDVPRALDAEHHAWLISSQVCMGRPLTSSTCVTWSGITKDSDAVLDGGALRSPPGAQTICPENPADTRDPPEDGAGVVA